MIHDFIMTFTWILNFFVNPFIQTISLKPLNTLSFLSVLGEPPTYKRHLTTFSHISCKISTFKCPFMSVHLNVRPCICPSACPSVRTSVRSSCRSSVIGNSNNYAKKHPITTAFGTQMCIWILQRTFFFLIFIIIPFAVL